MAKIRHGALEADAVTTIDLATDFGKCEVLNRGDVDIFFRVDGTDPEVDGDNCEVVPAGQWAVVEVTTNGPTIVKLISSSTPSYSVRGF